MWTCLGINHLEIVIELQGKNYPDSDSWIDPTDTIAVGYRFTKGLWELTRTHKGKKPRTWYYYEPKDAVMGFIAYKTNSIGSRTMPPTYTKTEDKYRGHNHKVIRALANNTCQIPGCDWPTDKRLSCDVHHIVAYKDGGDESADNKICLCKNHHAEADAGIITIKELFDLNGVSDDQT